MALLTRSDQAGYETQQFRALVATVLTARVELCV